MSKKFIDMDRGNNPKEYTGSIYKHPTYTKKTKKSHVSAMGFYQPGEVANHTSYAHLQ